MNTRRILFLLYDGFEILDMSGPASVFAMAGAIDPRAGYRIEALSSRGGPVRSGSGLTVLTRATGSVRLREADTVLVVGAPEPPLSRALADERMSAWLARLAGGSVRFGSVCTGAFVLAAIGLLDGRRATTHWAGCPQLAARHPAVHVQPDALYVADGRVWTSAGVATGIDMALAMVRRDSGSALANQAARRLVVYAHRPGNQSQFSALLNAQSAAGGAFSDVVAWIDAHLDRPLKVQDMARKAGMSERTFHRRFARAVGTTPSKYLQHARLERAKALLESGMPVKAVTAAVGFRSEAGFRCAFAERFGVSPALHRSMHATRGE